MKITEYVQVVQDAAAHSIGNDCTVIARWKPRVGTMHFMDGGLIQATLYYSSVREEQSFSLLEKIMVPSSVEYKSGWIQAPAELVKPHWWRPPGLDVFVVNEKKKFSQGRLVKDADCVTPRIEINYVYGKNETWIRRVVSPQTGNDSIHPEMSSFWVDGLQYCKANSRWK